MTNMDEIATYERDLANMESRIESVFADADVEAELPQADLDMLDVCFSMASGLVGVFVATNDDVAKWLEKVHDAASGNPGDCGVVQQMLGSLLFHKGDALDVYAPEEGFIARNGEQAPADFPGQVLDGDARRIVCMSSTYIAMLDALGEPQRVVGVSGIDYISNPYVASHKEQIGDVGYDGNMNYERLLSLSPDIVLLFGVSGASAMEPKLRELGIPYAYMGEYLEQSPLGKAEWLVAVAEIAGMRERGEEVFREIPLRYDSLKTLAAKAERKPVVMLNTPYGDSWLMAPPSSYVARLIADAGGQYVYTQDTGNQSRPIDTEEAYRLAEMSDCWINVGSAASLKELAEIVPKFMDTRPVREGRVYNNNRRTNPSGGNDYWESGVIHPDLILQDLIRIFHPELTDAEPTYYRKLN